LVKRGIRSAERGTSARAHCVPRSARTICLEDSHASVQHHCRKNWSPAAVTLPARIRVAAGSVRLLGRDGCQSQTKLAPSTFVACRKCLPLRSPPLGGFDTEAHSVR
jgi:hypothetical protein